MTEYKMLTLNATRSQPFPASISSLCPLLSYPLHMLQPFPLGIYCTPYPDPQLPPNMTKLKKPPLKTKFHNNPTPIVNSELVKLLAKERSTRRLFLTYSNSQLPRDHDVQNPVATSPQKTSLLTETPPQRRPVQSEDGRWTLNSTNSLGSATRTATSVQPHGDEVHGLGQNSGVTFAEVSDASEESAGKEHRPCEKTPYPSAPSSPGEGEVRQGDELEGFPWGVEGDEKKCWCCGARLVRIGDGEDEQCVECWASRVIYE